MPLKRTLFFVFILLLIASAAVFFFFRRESTFFVEREEENPLEVSIGEESTAGQPRVIDLFHNKYIDVKNYRLSSTSTEFITIVKIVSSTPSLSYSSIPKFVSDWATASSTVVINAGYFDEDNSPSGYLVAEGQRYGKRMFDQERSGLIVIAGGKLSIRDLKSKPVEEGEKFEFALQSYPFLIKNGAGAIAQDSGLKARRTAVGMDRSGNVYVLFVQSSSFSLYEFMNVLLQTKISFQDVLNLDGGPSSGIVIRSGEYEKVYNSLTPVPSVLSFFLE